MMLLLIVIAFVIYLNIGYFWSTWCWNVWMEKKGLNKNHSPTTVLLCGLSFPWYWYGGEDSEDPTISGFHEKKAYVLGTTLIWPIKALVNSPVIILGVIAEAFKLLGKTIEGSIRFTTWPIRKAKNIPWKWD